MQYRRVKIVFIATVFWAVVFLIRWLLELGGVSWDTLPWPMPKYEEPSIIERSMP